MTVLLQSSPFLKAPPHAPWIVGVAHFACGTLPYPLSRRDVERDTDWAARVYGWLGLEPRRLVHLIGDGSEEISWWPFENAAMRQRMPWIQAESGAFDASRTDMILRRFKLQAVVGLSEAVLDGLIERGRDPVKQLGGLQAVVATPKAASRLKALGLSPWTILHIGPVLAFESPDGGGARYDENEWRIDSVDGELTLTNIHARACPFANLRTGLPGSVEIIDGERRVFAGAA